MLCAVQRDHRSGEDLQDQTDKEEKIVVKTIYILSRVFNTFVQHGRFLCLPWIS